MKRTRIALFIAFAVAAFFIYQFGLTEGLAFQVKRARLIVTDQEPESRRTELRDDKSAEQNIGKLGATPGQTNGLWVFGGSLIPNPISTLAGRDRLVNTSSQSGFTDLYVSVYQSTPNSSGRLMYQDDDMAALITAAHANGQEVWAAYGDPGFPALGCGSSFPMQRMAEVAAYNASRSLNERFDGVVLDIEPAEPMSEADFQAMLTQYQCFRDALPSSIKLATAIRFFWTTPVEYPVGETTKPAYEHIIDMNFDNVIVMGYRDFAGTSNCGVGDGIICRDQDEVAYATSLSRSGLILAGIETKDVSPGEPETITFFEEGQVSYHVEARKVARHFESSSGFGGFAVHNYSDTILSDIAGWPDTLTVGTCDTGQNVDVEASGGTLQAGYSTLGAAFAAINAGTHTGDIAVEICGNTTETSSAIIEASGIGPASYNSILVYPVGVARSIIGSFTGAVIKLNGADNVTIDGRIGGSGRNLSVINNGTTAPTGGVWLSSLGVGQGSVGNTVRNLEISGNIDQSLGSGVSFGIIMSGTGMTVTDNGPDNDNNSFIANRIVKTRYGIVTRGVTTNQNISPSVIDNIIGPESFGSNQIGKVGIFMQADTGAVISGNIVRYVGCLDPQACNGADRMGIAIGNESWSTSPATLTSNSYTVVKNSVHNIVDELNASAVGINLATTAGGAATNNLLANNFVYNVRSNGTGPDQTVGIGIAGGNSDRVVFNSVSLVGDVDPGSASAATSFGSAIRIANANGTTHNNLAISNNSVFLDLSSSSTAAVRFYAISGNNAAYSFGTGGQDFNNLYINPLNPQLQTGGLGSSSGSALTSQYATLALWQNAYATPQDSNSIQSDPLYFSTTSDLHLVTSSPNIGSGQSVAGVVDDVDGNVRSSPPDIGADEFTAPTAAAVTVSGRVMTANRRGIGSTRVMLTGGNLTEPLTAVTNQFGYYHFEGIEAGQTYIITVGHKRYAFSEPSRVIELFDNLSDVDFVAVF